MRSFKELGIKPVQNAMTGEKIKINRVINREIVVTGYRIEQSKYPKNKSGKCLTLQVEIDGEKRVVFTGSDILIGMIQQVPESEIPFKTTIVKEGERFEFS
jgi:hypothetical protein